MTPAGRRSASSPSAGAIMAVAFCSLGLGTILLGVLLRRTTGHATVRTALLTLAGLLSFVSAAFHTDPSGVAATLHGRIHNIAGIVTFATMLATMLICAFGFRSEPAWRGLARPTAVLACTGVVAFFLVPALGKCPLRGRTAAAHRLVRDLDARRRWIRAPRRGAGHPCLKEALATARPVPAARSWPHAWPGPSP